jgi:hypothetical protein
MEACAWQLSPALNFRRYENHLLRLYGALAESVKQPLFARENP